MLKKFFTAAWRSIFKTKGVTFINITGLSVGMAAAVLILLWVQNELTYDTYHPNAKNIYRITDTLQLDKTNRWVWETAPLNLAGVVEKNIPEVENVALVYPVNYSPITFKFKNELFTEKKAAYVNKAWFSMFSYQFVQGNAAAVFKSPFNLILSETKAKKYFGNTDAVGQVIAIDSINYTVGAVIKDNPANSSFQYDVMLPLEAYLSSEANRKNSEEWGNFNFITFLQVHNAANIDVLNKKITTLLQNNKKDSSITVGLQSLPAMHFETGLQSSGIEHSSKKTVYIFSILAVLLIVTACINYVNLTTARASLRAKEITIRKIVGAQRRQLFMQFIAESLLVSIIALAVTLVLIKITLPLYNQLTEKDFVFSLTSVSMWQVLGGTLVLATLLNSLYPAALLSSFNPLHIFRGINVLKVKDTTLRKGLVVFQFTLSVMLIIGTIVVFKQLQFIQKTNPGYDRSQVIALQVPWRTHTKISPEARKGLIQNIKQQLLTKSSVVAVSAGNQNIVNVTSASSGDMDWEGKAKDYNPTLSQISADADFQKLFKLKMMEGRWYNPAITGDENNFILNETAVKELKIHKPYVGQRFAAHGDTGIIIGVVQDFHYKSMHEKIDPMMIFNHNGWFSTVFVKTKPGNVSASLSAVESVWKTVLPDDPFTYDFLDDTFNSLYKADQRVSTLILLFSVIVIIISSMGLFALAAFTAEQRTKEIGIRKVLGASVSNITVLLSKDFVVLVAIAIIIASPIAYWAMSKWLQDFAYRIDISVWMFLAAGAAALVIALGTISFQAIKSALANPVKSLRTE